MNTSNIPKSFLVSLDPLAPSVASEKISEISLVLQSLFTKRQVLLDYDTIYSLICRLVRENYGGLLFSEVKRVFSKLVDKSGRSWELSRMVSRWRKYKRFVKQVRDLLLFLDEKAADGRTGIFEIGAKMFRRELLSNFSRVKRQLIRILQEMRTRGKRAVETKDSEVFRMSIIVLRKVGVVGYRQVIIREFIRETKDYYRSLAEKMFQKKDVLNYLTFVSTEVLMDHSRCVMLFAGSDIECVVGTMKRLVVEELAERFLKRMVEKENTGFQWMLENNRTNSLRIFFLFLGRIEGLDNPYKYASRALENHVVMQVEKDIESTKDTVLSIVLKWIPYYKTLLSACFVNRNVHGVKYFDSRVEKAVHDAFVTVVNKDKSLVKKLCEELDKVLSVGTKYLREKDREKFFRNAIFALNFCNDKSFFVKYYEKKLCGRLLSGLSVSSEVEKKFIKSLKLNGINVHDKFLGMFKDLKVSEELNLEWKQFRDYQKEANFDLTCQVLNPLVWPIKKNSRSLVLPDKDLEFECSLFLQFFMNKYQERNLTWQLSYGTASVVGRFSSGNYLFELTTIQMISLLLFNKVRSGDHLDIVSVSNFFGVKEQELRRHILPLCRCLMNGVKKSKLLVKNDRKLCKGSKFRLNMRFEYHGEGPVQFLALKNNRDAFKHSVEKSKFEKGLVIDCFVCRTLKKEKQMEKCLLISFVLENFPTNCSITKFDICEQLLSLIKREFIFTRKEKVTGKLYYVYNPVE